MTDQIISAESTIPYLNDDSMLSDVFLQWSYYKLKSSYFCYRYPQLLTVVAFGASSPVWWLGLNRAWTRRWGKLRVLRHDAMLTYDVFGRTWDESASSHNHSARGRNLLSWVVDPTPKSHFSKLSTKMRRNPKEIPTCSSRSEIEGVFNILFCLEWTPGIKEAQGWMLELAQRPKWSANSDDETIQLYIVPSLPSPQCPPTRAVELVKQHDRDVEEKIYRHSAQEGVSSRKDRFLFALANLAGWGLNWNYSWAGWELKKGAIEPSRGPETKRLEKLCAPYLLYWER